MVETYDIRLFSKYRSLLGDAEAIPLPRPGYVSVTVRGTVGDAIFTRIGKLQEDFRRSRLGTVFAGWEIQRTYTDEELAQAQLLLLKIPFTEVAAEEYGTQYQDSLECEPEVSVLEYTGGADFRLDRRKVPCALHSKQIGPLRLPFRKLRKNIDVYRVWGGELIVSERFTSLIHDGQFTGATFFPISNADGILTSPLRFSDSAAGLELLSIAAGKEMSPGDWDFWLWLNYEEQKPLLKRLLNEKHSTVKGSQTETRNLGQVVLSSKPLRVSERTQLGATPFDTDSVGYHECDGGVIAGMRLVSPLSVIAASWDGSDLCRTDVFVGGQRQGLFRPHQMLVISKKLFQALRKHGLRGFQFEVVNLA